MRSSLLQLLCHLCSSAILVQYSPSKTSLHRMAMTRIRTSGCNPCLNRVLSCPVTNARLHPLSLILLNYQTQSLKSLRLASKRLHPHNAPPATSHSQVAMETPTTIGSRLQPPLWPLTPDAYISALKVLRPRPYDPKPQHPPYSPGDDISLYHSSLIQCPCRNHLFWWYIMSTTFQCLLLAWKNCTITFLIRNATSPAEPSVSLKFSKLPCQRTFLDGFHEPLHAG